MAGGKARWRWPAGSPLINRDAAAAFDALRGTHTVFLGNSVTRHVVIALHWLLGARIPHDSARPGRHALPEAESSIWAAHGAASAELDARGRVASDECKHGQRGLSAPRAVVNCCVAAPRGTIGDGDAAASDRRRPDAPRCCRDDRPVAGRAPPRRQRVDGPHVRVHGHAVGARRARDAQGLGRGPELRAGARAGLRGDWPHGRQIDERGAKPRGVGGARHMPRRDERRFARHECPRRFARTRASPQAAKAHPRLRRTYFFLVTALHKKKATRDALQKHEAAAVAAGGGRVVARGPRGDGATAGSRGHRGSRRRRGVAGPSRRAERRLRSQVVPVSMSTLRGVAAGALQHDKGNSYHYADAGRVFEGQMLLNAFALAKKAVCRDDGAWRMRETSAHNCDWVFEAPAERCSAQGRDGRPAADACACACAAARAPRPATARSRAPERTSGRGRVRRER